MRTTIIILGLTIAGITLLIKWISQPFVFISRESKTLDHGNVYNRIKYLPGWDQDVWIMQQSHDGFNQGFNEWDRLTIVVNKKHRHHLATFYQFAPGPSNFNPDDAPRPYRAPCLSCHANGPRAIRPQSIGYWQSFKVALLNLRIKSYLEVKNVAGQSATKDAPFKRDHPALDTPLPLTSCLTCHRSNGIRSPLTLRHAATAKFLVDSGAMPPFPFNIGEDDRVMLKRL